MRRRDLLAGAASLAVVGGGAAYALGDFPGYDPGEKDGFEPLELPGIEAPGSQAGTITIPREGNRTFVELFATSCSVCQRMMPELRAASEAVAEDVQYVSVTNEPLGHSIEPEAVAEWWTDHDGQWQLAHDEGLELTRALNANMVPYTAVFDGHNRLVWSDGGYKTEAELLEAIDPAPN